MSATIAEKLGSGELQSGDTGHHEKLYVIRSETSEASALSLLESTAPGTFGGLVRQTARVSPVDGSNDIWIGEAEYTDPEEVEPAEGSTVFSFNTSGGSQHITQSISTTDKKAPAGKTAPDFKGAINATEKGSVDGVDIIVPVYRWSETHVVPDAKVTNAYKGRLFALTGSAKASSTASGIPTSPGRSPATGRSSISSPTRQATSPCSSCWTLTLHRGRATDLTTCSPSRAN